MRWVSLSLEVDAPWAEGLADALLEHGALSIEVNDADAGTAWETHVEPFTAHRLWRQNVEHHTVLAGIAPAHLQGVGVSVGDDDAPCPEFLGSDGKDAAAAAVIQDRLPGAQVFIEPPQALPCRGMGTGPERESGIQLERQNPRDGRLAPRRHDPLVVANILASPLQLLAPLLAAHTCPGGHIVLAGILDAQAGAVCAAYAEWFDLAQRYPRAGWICLAGQRRMVS